MFSGQRQIICIGRNWTLIFQSSQFVIPLPFRSFQWQPLNPLQGFPKQSMDLFFIAKPN